MITSSLTQLDFSGARKVIISATSRGVATRPDNSRYELKIPYSDGTKHAIFKPMDFKARLGHACA
jgi:hypothetical protein